VPPAAPASMARVRPPSAHRLASLSQASAPPPASRIPVGDIDMWQLPEKRVEGGHGRFGRVSGRRAWAR